MPRVSVVIPYFNAGRWIDRTLRSVFAQRFADYEVVLVDDGSHEPLPAALRSEPRIRIVRQANRGLAGARNRGIAETGGEFVAPIDADDLWHPDYLAALVSALDAAPDAPFAYAHSYRIDEDDRLIPGPAIPSPPPRHDLIGLLTLNSVGCGSAAVFRRAAVVAAGGYDETLRDRAAQGAEDWKLILRLARRAAPVLVRRQLVAYRLTRTGMSQATPDRQLRAIEAVLADVRREFPELADRHFADARTMMRAWLLPAFLHQRMYRTAFGEAATAYLRNPLWWRSRNLRGIHGARLRLALAGLGRPSPAPKPLAALCEDGVRPFAFLAGVGAGPPQSETEARESRTLTLPKSAREA